MITQTAQIRVTLPVQLQGYLQTKAGKFGLSLSAYVKNLIINDVRDVVYPVKEMSEKAEKAFREAKRAEKNGELVEVSDIESFFRDL